MPMKIKELKFFLKEHKDITNSIEKLVRNKLNSESSEGVDVSRDEAKVKVNTNGTKR